MKKKDIADRLGMSVDQFYRFRQKHEIPDVFTKVTEQQLRYHVNEVIHDSNGDFGTKMTLGSLKSKKTLQGRFKESQQNDKKIRSTRGRTQKNAKDSKKNLFCK